MSRLGLGSYEAGQVPLADWMAAGAAPYRGDPGWTAPFWSDVEAELSAAHPFLQHGRARFFLAEDGRARALASIDEGCAGRGAIGEFEMLDEGAGEAVLEAARAWLRDQGAARVVGPMSWSIWYRYRFREDDFQRPSFLGEPYNPESYPQFFRAQGFELKQEYESVGLLRPTVGDGRAGLEARLLARSERLGVRIRDFAAADFEADMRSLYEIIVASYAIFPEFTRISWEEFFQRFSPLRRLLRPGLASIAEDASGESLGFLFAFPDLGERLRAMGGAEGWRGALRYLWAARRRTRRFLVLFCGLRPEWERRGLSAVFSQRLNQAALASGYLERVHCLMACNKGHYWERWQGEARWRTKYGLYEQSL